MPKNQGKRREPEEPQECNVPTCGRPAYARGLCQTHRRQLLTTGQLKPIRRYRKRTPGTRKIAGLRLSLDCAGKLQRKAAQEGISLGAAVADILEDWVRGRLRRSRR